MSRVPPILLILFLLLIIPVSAKTVTVGPGQQYTTIQGGIDACSAGDTVNVLSNTYTISVPINMRSGVSVIGAGYSSTIIKASSVAAFDGTYMIKWTGCSNTNLAGFTIDGNGGDHTALHAYAEAHKGSGDDGLEYHAANYLSGGGTLNSIHDMYFKGIVSDAVRSASSSAPSYCSVYNCQSMWVGHDFSQTWGATGWHFYNILIDVEGNCGIRLANCKQCKVDHCTIYADTASGWTALELENANTGNIIDHNILRNMHGSIGNAGITGVSATGTVTITNNVYYDLPGGFTTALGSVTITQSGNIAGSSSTDYKALGYGYGGTSDGGGTTPTTVYNGTPALAIVSPASGTSITLQDNNGFFYWADVNSTSYEYQVSNSNAFTTTIVDKTTSTVSAGVNLASQYAAGGTYYWRVRAKNDVTGAWCAWTATNSFTIAGNIITPTTAVFTGTIKDAQTGSNIAGAVCTLYNDSISPSMLTAGNGVYTFSVPYDVNGSAYYMTVQAAGYETPNNGHSYTFDASHPMMTQDIYLVKTPSYFPPHRVTFTAESPFGYEKYSGVLVEVWDGGIGGVRYGGAAPDYNSILPDMMAYTTDNGQTTFTMIEDHVYYLYWSDDSQNIAQGESFTPADSSYDVWLWNAQKQTPDTGSNSQPTVVKKESDIVSYSHSFTKYNLTSAYFNASIASVDGTPVSSYVVDIWQMYDNTTILPGGFHYTTSGSGNATISQVVPGNVSYLIEMQIVHPDLSYTIDQTYIQRSPASGIVDWADLSSIGVYSQETYSWIAFIAVALILILTSKRGYKLACLAALGVAGAFCMIGYLQPGMGDEILGVGAFIYLLMTMVQDGSVN